MIVKVPHFSTNELNQLIDLERQVHPKAHHWDIYKVLYQACFGPTHMKADVTEIAHGISKEYLAMDSPYLPVFQDIGLGKGYVRISLSILDDQFSQENPIGPRDPDPIQSLAGLIQQSKIPEGIEPNAWYRIWQDIAPLLQMKLGLESSQMEELHQLASALEVPHHSEAFREVYNPHYRILHCSLVNNYYNIGVSH